MKSIALFLLACSLGFGPRASGQSGTITTVAGSKWIFPGNVTTALNAPLGLMASVAVDAQGNFYAADASNNIVIEVTPAGKLSIVAGNGIAGFSGDGGPATAASLTLRGSYQAGIAFDGSGNLFIGDAGNNRVRKVSTGGVITTVAGNGSAEFSGDGGPAISASLNSPTSVSVDSAGNLYILDAGNLRVRKVSTGGAISTVAGNGAAAFAGDGGPASAASFYYPSGIALDKSGNLFIAEIDNRVREVSAATGVVATIAGVGQTGGGGAGDGGPATLAELNEPFGLFVDASGNLFIADSGNNRIRKVAVNGVITTVAGGGQASGLASFGGDGGQATSASLNEASGIVVDASGNLFIADSGVDGGNERIRKVSPSGVITTVAGNGLYRYSGDGGPAVSAQLNTPVAEAVDAAGNLFIVDSNNNRVRKVSPSGMINTVAGNGAFAFAGDGGPATAASLRGPNSVAVDGSGNLFIADLLANRIRKVSASTGIITTVAGSGNYGYKGDGGQATSAALNYPYSVALDAAGDFFIADGQNNVIRKVSAAGVITTVAGNGTAGFSGDGGPAISAELNNPQLVAVDGSGNLFISDTYNYRVRKVSAGGMITTVAGNGQTGGTIIDGIPAIMASIGPPAGIVVDPSGNLFISVPSLIRMVTADGTITTVAGRGNGVLGDGGPAILAGLFFPEGLALDSAGDLFIADTDNNRIREVLSSAVSYRAAPASLTFLAIAGGTAPGAQTINLSSSVAGLAFAATSSAAFLSVSPSSGSIPSALQVSVDPTGLSANTYSAAITINAPNASPTTQTIAVSFTINAATPSQLILSTQSIPFSLGQGASPGTAQLTISNTGSGSARYTAVAATTTGGNWLQIGGSPSGSITAASPVSLTVTATPGTLAPGTYSGTITVTGQDTGQTLTVAVILAITATPPKILLSQTGFTFTAVAQGGAVLPQTLGILNSGAGTLDYSVQATTQSGGSGWLSVSSNSGTVAEALVEISDIDVVVNTSALPPPGTYYGQITVAATGASNSPQSALVVLTVLPAGSNPGPDVRPTGLVFIGAMGAENPGSQTVTVANVTANATTFGTSVAYVAGSGWINSQPTNLTVQPDAPAPVVVQPDFSSLSTGVRRAALTIAFDDGSIRNVSVLSVVAPAGTPVGNAPTDRDRPRASSACTATKLLPQFTATGLNSNLTVGYPASIAAAIVDDCGTPLTSGSVRVSFNNGDPPISLISRQDGTWTNSWQPTFPTSSVTLTLTATLPSANLTGTTTASPGAVQPGSQSPPMLTNTPLAAATKLTGSFAPGDLMFLQGTGLADGKASSTTSPLQNQLAGASLLIGARQASLLYADPTQVIALVPPDLPVNSAPQILVSRDASYSIVPAVIISATHPAILTSDGSGKGQGAIYRANGPTTTLADAANPVNPGDSIVIYCTGLGMTDANGIASNVPTLTIGGTAVPISYAGLAIPANYPPAGAPTLLGIVSSSLGGLYQITAAIPAGLAGGSAQVVISSAGQTSQTGVTMMIAGASTGAAPAITSIDTAGGPLTIAQNGWIEIKGSNLAPSSVGTGVVWSNEASFAVGQLPTNLNGVSATVNGRSAFTYFVSPGQINVLTPLDSTTGPVQVVVYNNGVSSAPFTITENAVAPSFLLFGSSKYIVATHTDFSLAGPASLSSPGYPFTPVSPGETVIFYAVGFGLPSAPLTDGLATQSGALPTLPVITIGGNQAMVSFAGVISPGLYQFNVVIPANAASGDNAVTCTYGGLSTPLGDLITVQR